MDVSCRRHKQGHLICIDKGEILRGVDYRIVCMNRTSVAIYVFKEKKQAHILVLFFFVPAPPARAMSCRRLCHRVHLKVHNM